MIDAVKAVEDGMPVALAAREHNLPRSSLRDRVAHGPRHQRKPYLSHDEETELAEYITECASAGCSKTPEEIMTIAKNVAGDKVKRRRMSYSWYYNFVRRRRDLLLSEGDPNNTCAGFRNLVVNSDDELRPTVEIEAESDSEKDTSYYIQKNSIMCQLP